MKTVKKLLPLAVGIALGGLTGGGAQASGFQLMEQNASGLGNAYSGQAAAAENASTIFFNPAGMTRLPGKQFSVALNAIRPSAEFTNSGGSTAPGGLASPGGNGGDAGDWALVPNAYFSWQLNPNWWIGLGATVPFGLKTEYDQGWFGRFQAQKTEIKTIDVNPGVAFKISDAVSIAGGVSYQQAKVKLDRSQFLGIEARAHLDIDDNRWGWNIGAMFTLAPSTRIGVTYRSSMDYTLGGTIAISGIPVLGSAVVPVTARAEIPDTFAWGIAHQVNPKWELLGDITYTRWSKIKAVPIVPAASFAALGIAAGTPLDTFQFQFRDTYRIGVGANYKWRDDFTVKLGIAYDKSPVEDLYRTVSLPDNDRTWVAIGGKYQMSKQAALDFGYAHLFVKDGSINQRQGLGLGGKGNVVGSYDNDVNIVSVQFTYSF